MKFPKPIITREHGSWAVLSVPMVVGIAFTGHGTLNNVLLEFSALGVFLSYVPFHTILREMNGMPQGKEKLSASYVWASLYLLAGFGFILPLFLQGYFHLITFAVVGSASFFYNFFLTIKGQKTIISDLTAVAGLTLSAPSTYYISTGLLDLDAVVLWVLNFLFFGCSVFYVHMKINVIVIKKKHFPLSEKITLGRLNILYHLFVIAIVISLSVYNYTPLTATLAFIPMAIHAIYGTITLSGETKFKKLGLLLLAQSFLFGLLLIVAWS